jgi:hypothetical protein
MVRKKVSAKVGEVCNEQLVNAQHGYLDKTKRRRWRPIIDYHVSPHLPRLVQAQDRGRGDGRGRPHYRPRHKSRVRAEVTHAGRAVDLGLGSAGAGGASRDVALQFLELIGLVLVEVEVEVEVEVVELFLGDRGPRTLLKNGLRKREVNINLGGKVRIKKLLGDTGC